MIYSGIIVVLAGVFLTLLTGRAAFDVTLLRGLGRPFVVNEAGVVENIVRVKIVNRVDEQRDYVIEAVEPKSLQIDGNAEFRVDPGATVTEPIHLVAPAEAFAQRGGTLEARLRFIDSQGEVIERSYRLFGPAQTAAGGDE
ncbi:MAG: FixG Ig-like domain-containing protein [Planctomycetota bacterium]